MFTQILDCLLDTDLRVCILYVVLEFSTKFQEFCCMFLNRELY